jgi:UDP-N-acetylmuramate--alanine ligase
VDVSRQRLLLIQGGTVAKVYRVSTAAAGLNAKENSYGTPPGIHSIEKKIGAGMPTGTVFESREPTGQVWRPEEPAKKEDKILSRVLTLTGLENGVNHGPGLDSSTRYIYIHGTNHEDQIGEPLSQGCIRLTNRDVIDLFDRVEQGDLVVIV